MILKFISLSSSPITNIPIVPCTEHCIVPGKDKKTISFMLLFSPNHNCSYDHLNCSFFYNQVIFKGLSFTQILFAHASLRQFYPFALTLQIQRYLKKIALNTEITPGFISHVHICPTITLCLLVHLFPR